MKYILLALTLSFLAAGYTLAEEPSDVNQEDTLNLEEGGSSDYWLNWGTYSRYGLGGGYGYGANYGADNGGCETCVRPIFIPGLRSFGLNFGLYNPFYLWRSAPAVYPLDQLANPFGAGAGGVWPTNAPLGQGSYNLQGLGQGGQTQPANSGATN